MAPTALDELLRSHRVLRGETRSVAATLAAGAAVGPRRVHRLVVVVAATQTAEEAALFPALGRAGVDLDLGALVADHVEVVVAAERVHAATRAGARGLVASESARLAGLVAAHLDDEERMLVPVWPALSTDDDRRLRAGLRRALGPLARIYLSHLDRRSGT